MPRPQHVHEDRLFECYVAQRHGEAPDPPTAEHLADCDDCAARYADMARFMDQLRTEADAESTAAFTPERLRAQQQQIARRLESVGRPARVLSFPGRFVERTIRASTSRSPRWTAAAAAAGLFLGIAVGASYEWESRGRTLGPVGSGFSGTVARGVVPSRATTDVGADDAFILELDFALDRPHTRELAAFDAFTPHFREARDQR